MKTYVSHKLTSTYVLFAIGVIFCALCMVSLSPPGTLNAFSDKKNGDRLLNEYKSKCKDYDPSKKAHQAKKWNRCEKVRAALVQDGNCNFGGGKATERMLTNCAQRIENKFGTAVVTQPTQDEIKLDPIKNVGVNEDNTADGTTINSIQNIIFSLAGALALLFIVIGGVRYILSRGDPNATAQAKNTIVYALVGLVVTIMAYAIVRFVLSSL